jgi:hypothetical protein
MWRRGAILTVLSLLLVSCVYFSPLQIEESTTPITDNKAYTIIGPTEGKSCNIWFLGLIPIQAANRVSLAIEDALQQVKGDALINVTVDTEFGWYILITEQCTYVKGVAIKMK